MTNRREQNEQAVLSALVEYDNLPYGASYRDLSEATGLGLGTVFSIIQFFIGQGSVEHTPMIARSIKIRYAEE